jgi:S1-C subfamily serine protease
MNTQRNQVLMVAALATALLALPALAEAQQQPARAGAEARVLIRPDAQSRGWFGFAFTQVRANGAASQRAVVNRVEPDGGAARGGLQVGDTIVRWGDRADVVRAAAEHRAAPGETVRIRVRRAGRDHDLSLVAGERPRGSIVQRDGEGRVIVIRPDGRELDEIRRRALVHIDTLAVHADSLHRRLRVMLQDSLGPRLRELEGMRVEIHRDSALRNLVFPSMDVQMGLRGVAGAEFTELNPELSTYFGADRGVLVLRVVPETPAARSGLQAGDVVVRVNGQAVTRVAELRSAVSRAQGRSAEMEVVRKGRPQTVRMSWD